MSKELQNGLISIDRIQSVAELSILMDALAMRMRELVPSEEDLFPKELKDKIQQRRQAYLKGEVELTETSSILKKLRKEFSV